MVEELKRRCIKCDEPTRGYKYCPKHRKEADARNKAKYQADSSVVLILEEVRYVNKGIK